MKHKTKQTSKTDKHPGVCEVLDARSDLWTKGSVEQKSFEPEEEEWAAAECWKRRRSNTATH